MVAKLDAAWELAMAVVKERGTERRWGEDLEWVRARELGKAKELQKALEWVLERAAKKVEGSEIEWALM